MHATCTASALAAPPRRPQPQAVPLQAQPRLAAPPQRLLLPLPPRPLRHVYMCCCICFCMPSLPIILRLASYTCGSVIARVYL